MTQTIRHKTSSRTCDIYYHPNQAKPIKGYKNEKARFKYTVEIFDITEALLNNGVDVENFEFDFELLENDKWVKTLLENFINGKRFYTTDDSEIYFSKTLKEAQAKFDNFFC